ncbi:hypothetical protein FANTH_8263 [Fusarium anthophilum]|uniref:Zn(2)-C6 fungal-type domain-containing protein n=1 Tax=Fusarium anthophilum TaxID=48485 RepID=A0A8H4ZB38_9HYPO|nr:hypothetical protein FANTH_8263 [Fusarium anthophilum]
MKKTKCDGQTPCKRCRDGQKICNTSARKAIILENTPRGYAEVLEQSQRISIQTVCKLYCMVRNSQPWKLDEPEPQLNEHGQPVAQYIAKILGCVPPNSEIDLPLQSVFPEDESSMEELYQSQVSGIELPYYEVDCGIHGTMNLPLQTGIDDVNHEGTAAADIYNAGESNFALCLLQMAGAMQGDSMLHQGFDEWREHARELIEKPFFTYGKSLKQQKTSLFPHPETQGGGGLPYVGTLHEQASAAEPTNGRLHKRGSSTDVTAGVLDQHKAACIIKDDKHVSGDNPSNEDLFISDTVKLFSARGDSGPIVYDFKGGVVGLLHRGQIPTNSEKPFPTITPIELVFEDIKSFLEDEAEIRIAER